MTALSVNVNKVALIRNSRGQGHPNLTRCCETILNLGAHGITVHPRPDERHITAEDVRSIKELIESNFNSKELNIEGNPFDTVQTGTETYPGFIDMVLENIPDQVTLVPDAIDQLTSNHGWDLIITAEKLSPLISKLKSKNIRVSLFLDPGKLEQYQIAKELGVDRVELYTEAYANDFETTKKTETTKKYIDSAASINKLGLEVNAGHDLNQKNLRFLIESIPNIQEVSIGHALISESLYDGLTTTIKAYLELIKVY